MDTFNSNCVEKLIKLYQLKMEQLSQLVGQEHQLQYLVLSAEADALDRAIRQRQSI